MTVRLAYLCGEYPRATDTFIQREVAGLRRSGIHVETLSVRRPAVSERGSEEQRPERERTHYLLPCSFWRLVSDHLSLLFRSPVRYGRALWTALAVRAPGLRSLLFQLFYFAEAGMVAAHMKRRRLSHVHNHAPNASGYVTMLAAEFGDITYSLTLHGFDVFSEPTRWRLTEKLERSLFAVCVSHHARSQAMLWSNAACWDRYHVVHCGVESDHYRRRCHSGRGRRILFVGRFDRVKGLPILLSAFEAIVANHENVRLDLVGDGPQRPEIEDIVAKKGLSGHVRFRGYLSSEQVAACYAEADVMVLTSFAEGIPVVLIEAMASGLPVVATHIGGVPELVEHGVTGFLTPPGDADVLAHRIDCLLRDPEMRIRFGEAGRQKIERHFNLNREIPHLVSVFQSLLVGRVADVDAHLAQDHEANPAAAAKRAGFSC